MSRLMLCYIAICDPSLAIVQQCTSSSDTNTERREYTCFSKLKRNEYFIAIIGLGLNPGEGMDVCKCIVSSWRGGTLNSRRVASPLVRLVEEEEMWETSDHPQGVLPQNWGGPEQNRTVTCMVLKAKANDRRKNLFLSRDEFRGP
ncbi:uncharacterized protein TNCV_4457111 [Trichonephila clavipes]|nr:uncharacterized protein TNCV_4457111 [Trichonephila clavipes]